MEQFVNYAFENQFFEDLFVEQWLKGYLPWFFFVDYHQWLERLKSIEDDQEKFIAKFHSFVIRRFQSNESNEVLLIVENELLRETRRFDRKFVKYDKVLMIGGFPVRSIDKEHRNDHNWALLIEDPMDNFHRGNSTGNFSIDRNEICDILNVF